MSGDKDETFRLLEWIDGTLRRDDDEAAELLRRVGQSASDPWEQAGSPGVDASAPVTGPDTAPDTALVAEERAYTDAAFAAHIRQYYPEDEVLQAAADRLGPTDREPAAGPAAGGRSPVREDSGC